MKKVILIGNIGCGKTTLSQALTNQELAYKKTQAIEVVGNSILDTPGEYLEFTHYRGAVMIASAEAEIIIFMQSAVDDKHRFPPSYAGAFSKEVIGVVTKADLATKTEIKMAKEILKVAGARKIFVVSSYEKKGIMELRKYLSK